MGRAWSQAGRVLFMVCFLVCSRLDQLKAIRTSG
jgi:hypothetical protein